MQNQILGILNKEPGYLKSITTSNGDKKEYLYENVIELSAGESVVITFANNRRLKIKLNENSVNNPDEFLNNDPNFMDIRNSFIKFFSSLDENQKQTFKSARSDRKKIFLQNLITLAPNSLITDSKGSVLKLRLNEFDLMCDPVEGMPLILDTLKVERINISSDNIITSVEIRVAHDYSERFKAEIEVIAQKPEFLEVLKLLE